MHTTLPVKYPCMRRRTTNNDGVLLGYACADDCADCTHGSVVLWAGVQCLLMFRSASDIIIPPTKQPGVHATAFSVVSVGTRGCEDTKESHLHILVAPV